MSLDIATPELKGPATPGLVRWPKSTDTMTWSRKYAFESKVYKRQLLACRVAEKRNRSARSLDGVLPAWFRELRESL